MRGIDRSAVSGAGVLLSVVVLALALTIGPARSELRNYDGDAAFSNAEWKSKGSFFERRAPEGELFFHNPPLDETRFNKGGKENVVGWKIHIGGNARAGLSGIVLASVKALEAYNDKMVAAGESNRAVKYKVLKPAKADPAEYDKPEVKNGKKQQNNTKGKVITIYPNTEADIPLLYANLRTALASVPNIDDHLHTAKDPTQALGERPMGENKKLPLTISFGVQSGPDLVKVPDAFRNDPKVTPYLVNENGTKTGDSTQDIYVDDREFRRGNPDGAIPPWREQSFQDLSQRIAAIDAKMNEVEREAKAERAASEGKSEPKKSKRRGLGRLVPAIFRSGSKEVEISGPTENTEAVASRADDRPGRRAVSASSSDTAVLRSQTLQAGQLRREDLGLAIADSLVRFVGNDGRASFYASSATIELMKGLPDNKTAQEGIVKAAARYAEARDAGRPLPFAEEEKLKLLTTRNSETREAMMARLEQSFRVVVNPDGSKSAMPSSTTNTILGGLGLDERRSGILLGAMQRVLTDDANDRPRDAEAATRVEQARNFFRGQDRAAAGLPRERAAETHGGASSSSASARFEK